MDRIKIESLISKIEQLKRTSEQNRGRLSQIKKEKEKLLSSLESDFGVSNLIEAKKLLQKNYDDLETADSDLELIISKLNNLMENSDD